MTTVVAYQGNSFVAIGSDSRMSSYDDSGQVLQMSTLPYSAAKVCEVGGYVIGVAGDARAINIIQHVFEPPTLNPSLSGKRLASFITKSFVPTLRDAFEEQGYATVSKEQGKSPVEQNSTVLVAANGEVFVIESDYGWASDRSGIYAIGTGAAYALGAMSAMIGDKELSVNQAKTMVTKAMTVAASYDPSTGSPFRVVVQQRNS